MRKLRCPFCQAVFPALQNAHCPSCGKVLLLPPRVQDDESRARARVMRNTRKGPAVERPPFVMLPWLILMQRPRGLVWAIAAAGALIGMVLFTKVQTQNSLREPPERERARAELGVLRTALEWFGSTCGRYPTTEEGLWALVRDPGVPGWKGYYVESLYPDPWQRHYQYRFTNETVILFSLGRDGLAGTADDIAAPAPDFKALMERIPPPEA